MRSFPYTSAVAVLLLCAPEMTNAQWSTDPNVNNPICTTANQQQAPRVVGDGSGGAIITWWDYNPTTSGYDIYAQRIAANGIVQWAVNGIGICTDSALQHVPEMTSDGNGGAIIAWQDNRSGRADIYAQRVSGSGIPQWAADGVPVCSDTLDQTFPQLVSDGSGGAIVTWQDLRGGTDYVPYAQKLDANGVAQWALNGVLLSASGNAETPQIVSDETGGAIITWHQYVAGQFDIYVQRVSANGVLRWGSNGVVVCALASSQFRPQLTGNGSKGAIIVWEDYRNISYSNLYAQQVDSGGVMQWALNGVPVAPNTLSQIRHRLLSDGSGGTFMTWQYGTNEVYAQRINSSGVAQWAVDGVGIGRAGDSRFPQIATDGGTGALITWYDYRGSGNGDVFAQRINSAGTVQWVVNGVGICRDPSGQVFPRLVADGSGGAIITWEDSRNSATHSTDIYAQRVGAGGTLGGATGVHETDRSAAATFVLRENYPNPFNPSTTFSFSIPRAMFTTLTIFNTLGQEVATLVSNQLNAGAFSAEWNAANVASGVYFYRLTAGEFTQTKRLILLR